MKNVFFLIKYIFCKVLNIFLPRSKKRWVVGSWFGERYSDNSRYFFEYLNENKEQYKLDSIVWLTRNEDVYRHLISLGLSVYYLGTIKSYYHQLRAGVTIYDQSEDDFEFSYSHGSIKINLWHGIPLKKIGFLRNDIEKTRYNSFRVIKDLFFKGDKKRILSTSQFISDYFKQAFSAETIIGPYPRNEYLNGNIHSSITLMERNIINELSGKKYVIYLPTFRDNAELKFLGSKNKEEIISIVEEIKRIGYTVVTKVHYADDGLELDIDGIINLPKHVDIYPFLKQSSLLITDYSSVFFDYLYLDKEIIFYPYDLDYYVNEDRGLIFNYSDYTPGVKVFDSKELFSALEGVKKGSICYRNERKLLMEKIFDNSISMETLVMNIKKIES